MEKFTKTGKMQMITDVISFICFILCIMSVGVSIVLIISKLYPYLIISLSAFAIFGGMIYFFRKKYNSNKEERYEFTLDKSISYEDMKNQLEFVGINDVGYFTVGTGFSLPKTFILAGRETLPLQ